jgi:hypothetical protein
LVAKGLKICFGGVGDRFLDIAKAPQGGATQVASLEAFSGTRAAGFAGGGG